MNELTLEQMLMTPELEPFAQVIQAVLAMDESLLDNEEKLKIVIEEIHNQVLSEENQQQVTEGLTEFYRSMNYTRSDIQNIVHSLDDLFAAIIRGLDASDEKVAVVSAILADVFTLYQNVARNFNAHSTVIDFELMNENAVLPVYAHETDAGADIRSCETVTISANSYGNAVHTGLKMAMQTGWEMQIRPRSGMSKKTPLRLSNCVGTIDSGYRGEIIVLFDNFSNEDYTINVGDRIAQMVLAPSYQFASQQVDSVDTDTDRAEGGFGSTGV